MAVILTRRYLWALCMQMTPVPNPFSWMRLASSAAGNRHRHHHHSVATVKGKVCVVFKSWGSASQTTTNLSPSSAAVAADGIQLMQYRHINWWTSSPGQYCGRKPFSRARYYSRGCSFRSPAVRCVHVRRNKTHCRAPSCTLIGRI